jgi:hypothetical protein
MILACTGGGILVPLFINAIPVPLCQDAYPIAIIASFLLHSYAPILREVMNLSPVFKVSWHDCAATFCTLNDSPSQVFFFYAIGCDHLLVRSHKSHGCSQAYCCCRQRDSCQ